MCCLRYEYDTMWTKEDPTGRFGGEDRRQGRICYRDKPLAATLKVKLTEKPDLPPKTYGRDDITVISRAPEKYNNNGDISNGNSLETNSAAGESAE